MILLCHKNFLFIQFAWLNFKNHYLKNLVEIKSVNQSMTLAMDATVTTIVLHLAIRAVIEAQVFVNCKNRNCLKQISIFDHRNYLNYFFV